MTLLTARIVAEDGGGWLVVTPKGHAWLHGDRQAAIREKEWLDSQWRGRA